MEKSVVHELQEYVVLSGNVDSLNQQLKYTINTASGSRPSMEYKWSENSSKLLIDFYKKYKSKVGTFEVKSVKMMWLKIADELAKSDIHVTPNNCMNRWRVLERKYKKFIDDQNKTGRGRKYYEYQNEMEDIFGEKRNVHPEILLHNEDVDLHKLHCTEIIPETENSCNTVLNKNEKPIIKRVKKRSTTIERMRMDRKHFYEEKLNIEREKLIEMRRINDLFHERNDILKTNLKCKCQCNLLSET